MQRTGEFVSAALGIGGPFLLQAEKLGDGHMALLAVVLLPHYRPPESEVVADAFGVLFDVQVHRIVLWYFGFEIRAIAGILLPVMVYKVVLALDAVFAAEEMRCDDGSVSALALQLFHRRCLPLRKRGDRGTERTQEDYAAR